MAPVDPLDLATSLSQCLLAVPVRAEDRFRQLIQDCHSGRITAAPDSEHSLLLTATLRPYASLFSEEAVRQLEYSEIAIVNVPVCNATASVTHDGRARVLVFDGMINTIRTSLEISSTIRHLPPELDGIHPSKHFPESSAASLLGVYFGLFLYRYSLWGEPLPDFSALVPHHRREHVKHNWMFATWWLLFHERGHFDAGHLSGSQFPRPSVLPSDVAGNLTQGQRQELEADAYVFSCLRREVRGFHYALTSFALHAQKICDAFEQRAHDSHPLTVTRIERALEQSRTASRFVSPADGQQDPHPAGGERGQFDDLDRPILLELVHELSDLCGGFGLDLDAITEHRDGGWQSAVVRESDLGDPPSISALPAPRAER